MAAANDGRKAVFFGRFISAPGPESLLIRQGAILVSSSNGHGVIEKTDWTLITPAAAFKAFGVEEQDVDFHQTTNNGFFFPGFIDTHIHASQYPNVGIFGKSTLLDWLTTYTFPLEASLGGKEPLADTNGAYEGDRGTETVNHSTSNPLSKADAVYTKVIRRTLSYGTTTASYFATISVPATNLLADLAFKFGQRAYIGRVCMDHPDTCPTYYRDETPDQSLANAIASIEHIQKLDSKGELLAPIVTPRFAPSCQTETLSLLGQLATDRKLRVQTHISENIGELALVKHLFPQYESYTDVYHQTGLLTSRTILAHGIHLDDRELETIRTQGSKISHCPASNSALGSGFCPVRKLLDSGIDVSLGTDVSGGYSVSILDSVRQACLVSRQLGYVNGGDKKWNIGVTEGLWLATVGGAKCVGMEGRLGGFEPGMLFDVQEIDLSGENSPVDIFGWEKWDERIDKWVWNGDDRNVKNVWVGGRMVHSGK